jgi:uncharacterized protein (DUF3084 family)
VTTLFICLLTSRLQNISSRKQQSLETSKALQEGKAAVSGLVAQLKTARESLKKMSTQLEGII